MTSAHKIFCYVDETGQDTKGELFIVSIVITSKEREQLVRICETIENETGKGRSKWIKTKYKYRFAYLRRIFQLPLLRGKMSFAIYHRTVNYFELTVQTVARALIRLEQKDYKATIMIDGLPPIQERIRID